MQKQRGTELTAGGLRWSRRSVLLAGLLVAGCSKDRPTIESEDNTDPGDASNNANNARLREILDRRAKAVMERDEAGFLADLDESKGELVQQEKALFANLRQFTFKDFRYITEQIRGAADGGDIVFEPVVQVAQLTADDVGVGAVPGEAFRIRLISKGGKLVVGEIAGASKKDSMGIQDWSLMADAPWHQGPLKVIQAGNVCLVADRSVPDLDRYASVAEREAKLILDLWGDRLHFPGQVLFFTREKANFGNWYSAKESGPVDEFDGLTFSRKGVRKDGRVYTEQYAGARVTVNLATIALNKGDDPARTVRHELTHAITARAEESGEGFNTLGPPRWAIEGFARWTESINNAAQGTRARQYAAFAASAAKFNGKPPPTKEFYGKNILFNYDASSMIYAYIERTKGRDAAVEFHEAVIKYLDSEETPVIDLPVFNSICERVVGRSSGAFLQGWAGFLRGGA